MNNSLYDELERNLGHGYIGRDDITLAKYAIELSKKCNCDAEKAMIEIKNYLHKHKTTGEDA